MLLYIIDYFTGNVISVCYVNWVKSGILLKLLTIVLLKFLCLKIMVIKKYFLKINYSRIFSGYTRHRAICDVQF